MSLAEFNHQNVIAGIYLRMRNELIDVSIDGIFGLTSHFVCKRVRVENVVWL